MSLQDSDPRPPGIERALELRLGQWLGHVVRVVAIRREPYPYSSSHALESLEVRLADGRTFALLLKGSCNRAGMERSVRPAFVDDAQREAQVYREILGPCGIGAPRCLGSLTAPAAEGEETDTDWLVLERVPGVELYQFSDLEVWLQAARWLARLHARFAPNGGETEPTPEQCLAGRANRLLVRDGHFHRRWWDRAHGMARARNDEGAVAALARARPRFERAVERVHALPGTFIHGEFYPANVLVRTGREGPSICAVDWEMASLGNGALDLCALISGRWGDPERDAMIDAYWRALPPGLRPPSAVFRETVSDCRMLLAVQWLGWAADWTPPPEQANDWMTELLAIATAPEPDAPYFVSHSGNLFTP